MAEHKNHLSSLNLSRLTYDEVEKEIERFPALVVPLGGCEPCGRFGTFGVASACSETLANALSEKLQVLCAPVLGLGCSTPFMSFGGTAGVKSRTLTNIFCETVRMWFFQGFRIIVAIDALAENNEAIELARKRLKTSSPECTVLLFSLHKDAGVRAFVARHLPGIEPGRTEYGVLSMAAWIDPDLVRESVKEDASATTGPDAERFRHWHKRGADPEQFRKLFPDGSSSTIAARFNAGFGKQLFEYILQTLEENMASLLPTTSTNRKLHAPSNNC